MFHVKRLYFFPLLRFSPHFRKAHFRRSSLRVRVCVKACWMDEKKEKSSFPFLLRRGWMFMLFWVPSFLFSLCIYFVADRFGSGVVLSGWMEQILWMYRWYIYIRMHFKENGAWQNKSTIWCTPSLKNWLHSAWIEWFSCGERNELRSVLCATTTTTLLMTMMTRKGNKKISKQDWCISTVLLFSTKKQITALQLSFNLPRPR